MLAHEFGERLTVELADAEHQGYWLCQLVMVPSDLDSGTSFRGDIAIAGG